MRKLIARILVLTLLIAIALPANIYADDIQVSINGTEIHFVDQRPTIIDSRTLVPVRGVFEELGFDVEWCQLTQTATLTSDSYQIIITIGGDVFTTNGEEFVLDVPAQIITDRTMLPIRAVLESVGYNVDWCGETNTVIITTPVRIVAICARGIHPFAVTDDGTLWTWGIINIFDSIESPRRIMDNVIAVSSNGWVTAAITSDNALWTWGSNNLGMLGDGTMIGRLTPGRVMEDVAAVSVGSRHIMALKTDGGLWTWGGNRHGQLGDGTSAEDFTIEDENPNPSPTRIMDGISSILATESRSMAVSTDGTLYIWGWDNASHLGMSGDSTAFLTTPTAVLNGVRYATQDSNFIANTYFILDDGNLWALWYNTWGQVGDITTTVRTYPVKVLENVITVSAGWLHALAITGDGRLWAWGENNYGQLGDGTTESRLGPVFIMDNVVAVSAGTSYSLAIRTDGTLWAWGSNDWGQLGDETRITPIMNDDNLEAVLKANQRHSPIQITIGR